MAIFLIFTSWLILCFVVGFIGSTRKIGFTDAFLLSIFLSPLVGIIIVFNFNKKEVENIVSGNMLKLIEEGDILTAQNHIDQAIEKYHAALTYTDKGPNTNYKLAKLYSLKLDFKASLFHLSNAVDQGYKNFDNINHDEELMALRNTIEFKNLVNNGYKKTATIQHINSSHDRIQELEKICNLYEKGVLTKDELEIEKNKIFSKYD